MFVYHSGENYSLFDDALSLAWYVCDGLFGQSDEEKKKLAELVATFVEAGYGEHFLEPLREYIRRSKTLRGIVVESLDVGEMDSADRKILNKALEELRENKKKAAEAARQTAIRNAQAALANALEDLKKLNVTDAERAEMLAALELMGKKPSE